MAYQEHIASAQPIIARCAVVTLSDTRDESTDASGLRIQELLVAQKHVVARYQILPDEPQALRTQLDELLHDAGLDVIITNGGTGISKRDQTIDVIEQCITHPLPGFGELFRMLSFQQIGSGAMLSRAVGGIAGAKLIFALPGSTKAVELAMTKLILPEVKHLLAEMRK